MLCGNLGNFNAFSTLWLHVPLSTGQSYSLLHDDFDLALGQQVIYLLVGHAKEHLQFTFEIVTFSV